MKRILFVDDDARVLDGLRRIVRPMREQWDASFANGGEAALDAFSRGGFDVVVTDMRMPGMDGAALLAVIKQRFPNTARIVLSGHTEVEAALRAVPVAHQFLSKPCDARSLIEVVERACTLQATLADERIRTAVGGVEMLPPLPRIWVRVNELLQRPNSTTTQIAEAIAEDVGLSAKMLQLVNSSFFGLRRRLSTVREAIVYLGVEVVKSVILSASICEQRPRPIAGFSVEEVQKHSLFVASIARRISPEKAIQDQSSTAAMLHDAGKLVMAMTMPDPLERLLTEATGRGAPLHDVEYAELGFSHAEVGAFLLGLWGLPYPIVDAVANHHRPQVGPVVHGLDVVDVVHVAHALSSAAQDRAPLVIDRDYAASLGILERLPVWEADVAAQAAEL